MFTTFATNDTTKPMTNEASGSITSLQAVARPKRQQVLRACVWCRTHRIKCDSSFPCTNCRARNRKCSNFQGDHMHLGATEEIAMLKARIKELEKRLEEPSGIDLVASRMKYNLERADGPASLPISLDPYKEHGGNRKYYNWDCISTKTSQYSNQYYGYSSSFYFIHQMTSYLNDVLQQGHDGIQPFSPTLSRANHVSTSRINGNSNDAHPNEHSLCENQSQMQENYWIKLYFNTFHTVMPVLDEVEFRTYHGCLWETIDLYRRPSALVDIVLALAMQSNTNVDHSEYQKQWGTNLSATDTGISAHWHYQRCQSLLSDELEDPSIRTFQGHLLTASWLLNASRRNLAHSVMATGIRIGIILGLHLEPQDTIPLARREFQKRLWWAMYSLEIRLGMELGRPLAVSISMVTCSLPKEFTTEGEKTSHHFSQQQSMNGDAYLIHYIKLMLATRAIYITFYHKCAEVLSAGGHKIIYDDCIALEACAQFLHSRLDALNFWLESTPGFLKLTRTGGSPQSSSDELLLQFDRATPTRILRQSITLELEYHHLAIILYRPFIFFADTPILDIPVAMGHATSCVRHAIASTNIMHQTLRETDNLISWHRVFAWQWDSFLSLVGYIVAFPTGPSTQAARGAASTAMMVLDLIPRHLQGNPTAADIARDFLAKSDQLIERSRGSISVDGLVYGLPVVSPFNRFDTTSPDCYSFDSRFPDPFLMTTSINELTCISEDNWLEFSDNGLPHDLLAQLGEADGNENPVLESGVPEVPEL
ncbi:unnamed protein product [Periconia digitata]|uniref:Zn(2)-C6 fungal-type domain-containing protein n=1 Tax=Periconia digitata TaxID=1303443 RepID=A0A9W4UCG0_9PLEO|nr:unnamed protein product [Periconia digitata]